MDADLLPTLALLRPGPCVSIFFHKKAAERHADDRRRLGALIDQAEKALADDGAEAATLLAPARALATDAAFWRDRHEHAALFLAPGFARVATVAHPVDDQAYVGPVFQLRPLLAPPAARRFFLLALHADHVALYDGDGETLAPSRLHLPTLHDAVTHDCGHDLAGITHTGGVETPVASDHAHPRGAGDTAHRRIVDYYHVVAAIFRAGHPRLRQPVVLAGTGRNIALFRAAAHHLFELHPQAIAVDPDGIGSDELVRRVQAVIEPYLAEAWRDAIARLRRDDRTLPIEREASSIVAAAAKGQVDTLLIARGARAWGRFVPGDWPAQPRAIAEPGDEDLLNRAAIETIRHRGCAYEVDAEDLEPGCKALALLRYLADRYQAEAPPAAATAQGAVP